MCVCVFFLHLTRIVMSKIDIEGKERSENIEK